jgi:hypothetical protein
MPEFKVGDKVLIKSNIHGYQANVPESVYEKWKKYPLTINWTTKGISTFEEMNLCFPNRIFIHDKFSKHKERMLNA